MKHIKVNLLDNKGEVQYGLKWGMREKRDPNQAYLQLEPEVYKGDFFPPKGKYFIVNTDDDKTLIFNRAQKDYGCALQTPENNAILGIYIRERLGVPSGHEISKTDIEKYGKDNIDFYKIDELHYLLSFSNKEILGDSLKEGDTADRPLQLIYYGAPGSGKSRRIKDFFKDNNIPKENIFRTTFHPDSDYSTFVGSYKPSKGKKMLYGLNGGSTVQMKLNDKPLEEEIITYQFIPQTFLSAYIRAYQNPDKKIYIVIEEINRGNCAQIFGDLFQLLDRDDYGKSEYPIKADTDLKKFLEDELGEYSKGIADGELCLPSNLYIFATMNTSDQSLFPIDSAFKRRWDWEYEPIKYNNTGWMIEIDGVKYSWVKFQKEVNDRILKDTGSEDKMMGDFFVNPRNGFISKKLFLNKILFYLWNDVCKDGDTDIFPSDNDFSFSKLYSDDSSQALYSLMENLGIQPEQETPEERDNENNFSDSDGENSAKIPKYTINGSSESYTTPTVVRKVIEDYASQHTETSIYDMIQLWNGISERNNCVVAEWEPSANDNQSFANKRRSEIKWGDGKSIWVINGWTKVLFDIFIRNVKNRLGIDIKEVR